MATEQFILIPGPVLLTPLHILIFGSTLLVYNAPRTLRRPFAHENNDQGKFRNPRTWYFTFFFLGLIITLYALPALSMHMLIACAVLGTLAFAYSLPILPLKNKKRLRDFGWLKILTLASVWTIATSVLPIVYHGKMIFAYPFEILLRLVFIFTLCIIFDIRDMQTDLRQNLYTLPNKMGTRNSYRLINGTLLLFVLLSGLQYIRYPMASRLISAIITAIITRIVVGYLRKHPTDRAYMGLADGMMLLYSILVVFT